MGVTWLMCVEVKSDVRGMCLHSVYIFINTGYILFSKKRNMFNMTPSFLPVRKNVTISSDPMVLIFEHHGAYGAESELCLFFYEKYLFSEKCVFFLKCILRNAKKWCLWPHLVESNGACTVVITMYVHVVLSENILKFVF